MTDAVERDHATATPRPDLLDDLSVVIVNYNTRDYLETCLTYLVANGPAPEIIVVDNASTDGSATMVRERFSQVKLIEPGRNTWFCGGNNIGIAAATRRYVLLLNPDAFIPPSALIDLVHFLDIHPEYAGATAQLRYRDGEVQRTCSRIPTYRYLLLTQTPLGMLFSGARRQAEAHHWYEGWARDRDFDVEAMPGSCTLMRRGEIMLDANLWLYFPEDDLAQRNAGRKFRFIVPREPITHVEKSATQSARAARIYFRDLMIYARKHHGTMRAVLLWVMSRPLAWGIALRWWLHDRGIWRRVR